MKKQNINQLYKKACHTLSTLNDICIEKGIHLDNDLETGLFMLLLDENTHEMQLLQHRIEMAIKKIENGTFKLSQADDKLHINTRVA